MSQELRTNIEKAPQRALLKALGLTDEEIAKPLIAIVSAKSEIVPGHMHLDAITDAVKAGVYAGGCTPVVIPSIGVCDGLAMGHNGMRYALARAYRRRRGNDAVRTRVRRRGIRAQLR